MIGSQMAWRVQVNDTDVVVTDNTVITTLKVRPLPFVARPILKQSLLPGIWSQPS